jgi:hypothetical protein
MRCGAAKESPIPPQTFPVVGVKQLAHLSGPDGALLTRTAPLSSSWLVSAWCVITARQPILAPRQNIRLMEASYRSAKWFFAIALKFFEVQFN